MIHLTTTKEINLINHHENRSQKEIELKYLKKINAAQRSSLSKLKIYSRHRSETQIQDDVATYADRKIKGYK